MIFWHELGEVETTSNLNFSNGFNFVGINESHSVENVKYSSISIFWNDNVSSLSKENVLGIIILEQIDKEVASFILFVYFIYYFFQIGKCQNFAAPY